MTTKTEMPDATGMDEAMEEAQRAGDGGAMDRLVERMAERLGGTASVHAVFGDPIERNGLTVIPVARVRWGFGGGSGTGPAPAGQPGPSDGSPATSGSGAGGGVTADPVGYLEIGPDGAAFRPITPAMPSPGFMLATGATFALVVRAIARLVRR